MKRLSVVLLAALLGGCWPEWEIDDPVPLYFGNYETGGYHVDWYFHSLITSTTEPVVVVRDSTGSTVDSVAVSNDIFDIQTPPDSLILFACRPVEIRHSVGLNVRVVVEQEERCNGTRAGGQEWSR